MKTIVVFFFIILNCSTTTSVDQMTVSDQKLKGNLGEKIFIEETKGRGKSFLFWVPEISKENFTHSLKKSLLDSNAFKVISTNPSEDWHLKVFIEDNDRDWIGGDFTNFLITRYTLTHKNKIVFNKLTASKGTGTISDSLNKNIRSNIANERAVRENIKQFLLEIDGLK